MQRMLGSMNKYQIEKFKKDTCVLPQTIFSVVNLYPFLNEVLKSSPSLGKVVKKYYKHTKFYLVILWKIININMVFIEIWFPLTFPVLLPFQLTSHHILHLAPQQWCLVLCSRYRPIGSQWRWRHFI